MFRSSVWANRVVGRALTHLWLVGILGIPIGCCSVDSSEAIEGLLQAQPSDPDRIAYLSIESKTLWVSEEFTDESKEALEATVQEEGMWQVPVVIEGSVVDIEVSVIFVSGLVAQGGGSLQDQQQDPKPKPKDPPTVGDTDVRKDQECKRSIPASDSGCKGKKRTQIEAYKLCKTKKKATCKVTYSRIRRKTTYEDDKCQVVLFHTDTFAWVCK